MNLSFLIMVNGQASCQEVLDLVEARLPLVQRDRFGELRTPENWVEVRENEDFDARKARDAPDNYLYFPLRLEVVPRVDVDLDQQVELARLLKGTIEACGLEAVVCANFEDLV